MFFFFFFSILLTYRFDYKGKFRMGIQYKDAFLFAQRENDYGWDNQTRCTNERVVYTISVLIERVL